MEQVWKKSGRTLDKLWTTWTNSGRTLDELVRKYLKLLEHNAGITYLLFLIWVPVRSSEHHNYMKLFV